MKAPFKDIALAFSGGGFRAAGFTLGTLSYLEKIGLLPEVRAISSVSGGSITAVKYAQSLIDEQDFETFFKSYYEFLEQDKLADNSLKDLNTKSIWEAPEYSHKTRNTINAFAIQYNKFANQKTLGDFHAYAQKEGSSVKKLIINATDFSEAIQFRIKNVSGSEKFGNGKIDSSYRKNWEKVKLGDALAASSAFPGGFEPILFPNDFYGEKSDKEYLSLMDGGIVDNQGASSLLPSDNDAKSKYGFYFISDVASPYIDEPLKTIKVDLISKIIGFLSDFTVLLTSILFTLVFYALRYNKLTLTFLYITILILLFQAGLIFVSRKINKMTGLKNRFRLPTRELGHYIANRVNSLVFMMSIVMLKNNRRRNANNLYERFRNQSITSTIYELRCQKNQFKKYLKPHPEHATSWDKIKVHTNEITDKIIKASSEASKFGTTLWFKDDTILDKLIACGEFTACYNLIAFMVENEKDYPLKDKDNKVLLDRLIKDWNTFQNNPKFLVNLRKLQFKSDSGLSTD